MNNQKASDESVVEMESICSSLWVPYLPSAGRLVPAPDVSTQSHHFCFLHLIATHQKGEVSQIDMQNCI